MPSHPRSFRSLHLLLMCLITLCGMHSATVRAGTELSPGAKLLYYDTPHFRVVYQDGEAAEAAREFGAIAEEVRANLTRYLGMPGPRRFTIMLLDNYDTANGTTSGYPYNVIKLYLTRPEPPVSGSSDISDAIGDTWMRELFTHEFTHAIHINRLTGWTKLWAILFHSSPYYLNFPGWFTEGIAVDQETQLGPQGRGRSNAIDMFLRTDMLNDRFLPIGTWGNINGWPRGGSRYLYGGRFMKYVTDRFGQFAVRDIIDATNRQVPYLDDIHFKGLSAVVDGLGGDGEKLTHRRLGGLERGFLKATGMPLSELVRDWKRSLSERYWLEASQIEAAGLSQASPLTHLGGNTRTPALSPDGRQVAYVAASDTQLPGLEVVPVTGGRPRHLLNRADLIGNLAWAPDGSRIVYGRLYDTDSPLARVLSRSDLFAYDFASRKEVRLTRGLRVRSPSFSPDGRWMVAVAGGRGQTRLIRLNADGSQPRDIFAPGPTYQLSTPVVSPDGSRIAFSVYVEQEPPARGRFAIGLVNVDGSGFKLVPGRGVEREPSWIDNDRLVFSSDRSGIFNLYAIDLSGGALRALTNLQTGAFQPQVRMQPASVVVYRDYSPDGFDIRRLELGETERSALLGTGPGRLVPDLQNASRLRADVEARYGAGPAAESSVQLAKEPVQLAKEPVQLAKEPVQLAKEPAQLAKEPVQLTKEPVQLEKEPAQLAKEPVQLAKEAVQLEKEPVQLEKEPVQLAKEPVQLAKEPVQLAKEPVQLEKEPVQLAKEPVQLEKEPLTPEQAGVKPLPDWPAIATQPYYPLQGLHLTRTRPIVGTDEGGLSSGYTGGTTLGLSVTFSEPTSRHQIFLSENYGLQSGRHSWAASYFNQSLGMPIQIYIQDFPTRYSSVTDDAGESHTLWLRGIETGMQLGLPFQRGRFSAELDLGGSHQSGSFFSEVFGESTVPVSVNQLSQQLSIGYSVGNAWRNPAQGHFLSASSTIQALSYLPPNQDVPGSNIWTLSGSYIGRKWVGRGPLDLELQGGHRSDPSYPISVGGYDGTWALPGIQIGNAVSAVNVGVASLSLAQDLWRPDFALGEVPWLYLERITGAVGIGSVQGFDGSFQPSDAAQSVWGAVAVHLFTLRSGLDFVPQIGAGVDLRTGATTWWFTLDGWPALYRALLPVGLASARR